MQLRWLPLLTIVGGFARAFYFAPIAEATSTTLSAAPRASSCTVSGEFLGPARKENRIVWRYRRSSPADSAACRKLSEEFEVWIPGGAYSTLSGSIVYPAHIVEPKPGQRFPLRLLHSDRPTPGWYFSGPHPRSEENRK